MTAKDKLVVFLCKLPEHRNDGFCVVSCSYILVRMFGGSVYERERLAGGKGERKVNAKNVYLTSRRNFSGIFLTMHLHHVTASNTCSVAVLYVLYTFF